MRNNGDFGASVPDCLRQPLVQVSALDTLAFQVKGLETVAYHVGAVNPAGELLAPARGVSETAKKVGQLALPAGTLLAAIQGHGTPSCRSTIRERIR